ncbi:PQQ-binding-like beta-propeller repeat protein, partial [Cellulomonas sp. 179-A 9B4 NHS]|uniref:outer membrane protein assembly factor BamB family protein n=1 Tax=Cellulomonas sp. 179-A 9B4 NHS TaxID=3142379 RepID=UPI00399FB92E
PGTPRARRRRRRALAAGVGAVAVALLGAQLVTDARERAVLAELRAVPGVRAPVPETLAEVWRVPVDRLPYPVVPAGDGRLGARETATGTELVALDPATGADAWVLPLTSAPADAEDAIGTPFPTCDGPLAPGTARPGRLVCLVTDAWSRDAGLTSQEVPATTSRLVAVRTSDGAVVADHDVTAAPSDVGAAGAAHDAASAARPSVPATSLALLGDVAVLGHPVEPDAVLVRAVDVATGEELWRRPPVTIGPAAGEPAALRLRRAGDAVAVPGRGGFDLVARDGTVLRHVAAGPTARTGGGLSLPEDDGLLVLDDDGWRLATPQRDVRLPGTPLVAAVDDGSAGGLVLAVTADGLHALATTTGAQRWSVSLPGVESALVVRGRVHALAPDGVHTYDARTGAPLWQRTHGVHDQYPAGPAATDGQQLYVPVTDEDGGGTVLLRLGLGDGRAATPLTVPRDVVSVSPRSQPLVGWTADGVAVGLR